MTYRNYSDDLSQFKKSKYRMLYTPAWTEAGESRRAHDDWFTLELAAAKKGAVISNDAYEEEFKTFPKLANLPVCGCDFSGKTRNPNEIHNNLRYAYLTHADKIV